MRVFALMVAINAMLAAGDLCAKLAVAGPARDVGATLAAIALWILACTMWLPLMRASGFTRLVALADALGLVLVAGVGYAFLGERLALREGIGVGFALAAVALLA